MPILHITVRNKRAAYCSRDGSIVCGNSDYSVQFDFDAEWAGHTLKTARFVYGGHAEDVLFEGDTVAVPKIRNVTAMFVGVFAGDLKTTTPAIIPAEKSILCEEGLPPDPGPGLYEQIMAVLQAYDPERITRIEEDLADLDPGRIDDLENTVNGLLYAQNPLTILEFRSSPSLVEIGSTVPEVTLSWRLNLKPASVLIAGTDGAPGENLDPAESGTFAPADGKNLKLAAPGEKRWSLTVTHEQDGTPKTASAEVVFANRIYYGISTIPAVYDRDFVRGLQNSPLRASKMASITANATSGRYIYYCQPVRLGACVFSFGANEGGVSLVDTISFMNDSGYTENYYIYRSDQPDLGNTTLGVK